MSDASDLFNATLGPICDFFFCDSCLYDCFINFTAMFILICVHNRDKLVVWLELDFPAFFLVYN